METNNSIKSAIYNLILVDQSGSMLSIAHYALSGLNETIQSIKVRAKKHPEQMQYISIVTFCGCEFRYLFDKHPAEETRLLNERDYHPCCSTPLYDAIGRSVNDLLRTVREHPNTAVAVTIISDGYENASTEYRLPDIRSLIGSLREKGWMFAYIGMDHDVDAVAYDMCIPNSLTVEKSEKGVSCMFSRFNEAREAWSDKAMATIGSPEGTNLDDLSENFFAK